VLLFVIGGVSAAELRDAREAAAIASASSTAGAQPVELLLGGTRLLTPQTLAQSVWQ
jgi:hypothetical protein